MPIGSRRKMPDQFSAKVKSGLSGSDVEAACDAAYPRLL
jgi:hypothetical protein